MVLRYSSISIGVFLWLGGLLALFLCGLILFGMQMEMMIPPQDTRFRFISFSTIYYIVGWMDGWKGCTAQDLNSRKEEEQTNKC